MSKTSLILSVLMTVGLVVFMAPGILAMNRGKTLRNIALWLAIFTGLGLIYQNFGPGSPHPLFSYRLAGVNARPDSGDKAGGDKEDADKDGGQSGLHAAARIGVVGIRLIIPDAALREAIAEAVNLAGYGDARTDADISAALNDSPVVIILDESAVDKKSLKAFQSAVGEGKKTHIFFLGEADAGWADNPAVECFSKPLRLGHLLARLTFRLGTMPRLRSEALIFGPWRFEPQNRQITRQDDGAIIRLTEKETALLDYLAQSDAPVGREELLAAVWGHDGRIDTHTLETHIYQLRRKLGPEENLLVNEGGAYCLKG